MRSKIIIGQVYHKYTVVAYAGFKLRGKSKSKSNHWHCVCECGTERVIESCNLLSGHSKGCGCNPPIPANKTHGKCNTREFSIWSSMKKRCYYPQQLQYKDYGGKGITICDRWLGPQGFQNFLSDMGPCPPKMQIDRIDNNGSYEPSNCRWATRKQQCRNRRSNRMLTFNGLTASVAEWSEFTGIGSSTICARIKSGWSIKDALTKQVI